MHRVYLDHAASTPLKPAVREAMLPYLNEAALMANPSSSHADGRAAAAALASLRQRAAARFACAPQEVVFNSGGSEGDTHALLGAALLFDRPIHLAISAIEHEAVAMAAARLRAQGHRVTLLPVTGDGVVPLEAAERLLGLDRVDLVSVMAVNNEIGTLQPVREIAELCRERGVLFHSDAVRAVGHGLKQIITDPAVALLNCTAHKFGGPRGVGLLVQREDSTLAGRRLPQLICGGGQEGGSRAGTENLAGIAGLVCALELATPEESAKIELLRSELERGLAARFPEAVIHGAAALRATHITSVAFPGASGSALQHALDERGISVGTGSACHEGGEASSPVLRALGVPTKVALGTLRISLGWSTTREEIERLLVELAELLH